MVWTEMGSYVDMIRKNLFILPTAKYPERHKNIFLWRKYGKEQEH